VFLMNKLMINANKLVLSIDIYVLLMLFDFMVYDFIILISYEYI
jgi:hypothetical protein